MNTVAKLVANTFLVALYVPIVIGGTLGLGVCAVSLARGLYTQAAALFAVGCLCIGLLVTLENL